MAVFEFKFPDVGEGIHEGKIVSWKVKVGDKVQVDQVLGEVETDKAIVEIPSPKKGKVVKLQVVVGGVINVGETMVVLEVEGSAGSSAGGSVGSASPLSSASSSPANKKAERSGAEKAGGVVGFLPESEDELFKKEEKIEKKADVKAGVLATPPIRALAKELGVDISLVVGTGFGGRITEQDVRGALKSGASSRVAHSVASVSPPVASSAPRVVRKYDFWGYIEHVPLAGMRKTIAHHMEEAWTIPTVSHMDEMDVTALVALREKEKASVQKKGVKLTYLPFIMKAVIEGLKKHPLLNATLDKVNNDIVVKKYFNIGFAVDTGDGLIVPVVKGADKKDLYAVASEIDKLASAAREKKNDIADLKGGSFTLTNIGSIGGLFFTPVINFPEVAILGIGKIYEKAVVVDGKIVVRKVMPLVVSFDHRVVDGAEAARFLNDVISALQKPETLL